ncbi:hypothetical protein Bca101_062134 [Brassica carinata]
MIALSHLLGADRSLAVTWSLSRSHTTLALSLLLGADPSLAVATLSRLLEMDRSLVVTLLEINLLLLHPKDNSKSFKVARGSWASNHEASHRQVVVRRSRYSTRITLSPLLGTARSLAITRHSSLSRRYLAKLVLSRLLGMAHSLAVTRQLTLPSIATHSGGSEHCPHRSFTQLSPTKLRLESEVCP